MNRFTKIAIGATLLATPLSAHAEDSSLRSTVKAFSEKSALGQRQVRRFKVKPTHAAAETRAKLLTGLALSPADLPEGLSADEARATGDGFVLHVGRGGAQAYYRRQHAGGAIPEPTVRPSLTALEPRATSLVKGSLAPFIRLGTGETLKAWKVTHEIVGSVGTEGAGTSELVSSTVTFTRLVDGLPILGPDSKVHVTHAADGTLIGFEFDWPELETVDEQATVAIAEVRARADMLAATRGNQLTARSLECGYYTQEEAGAHVLQPVCLSSYRAAGTHGERLLLDVVPVAAHIPNAANWQEARFLTLSRKK